MSLTYMTPGVVGSGGRANSDNNTNFVANGSRNSTSDVLIDGVTVTTVEQNSGITDLKFSPSVDAVQEFKMQTNFFSAEYGQTGGAVVNMVTKSGTNDFHGTGYYFLRHSDLNSNNWFSNRSGRSPPYYRRDQFGGVVGGPVIKNKTFFFAIVRVHEIEEPVFTDVYVPDARAAGRRLLEDVQLSRPVDDHLQPVRHVHERRRNHRAAAFRGQYHSRKR